MIPDTMKEEQGVGGRNRDSIWVSDCPQYILLYGAVARLS
jgi:hypothetical protein